MKKKHTLRTVGIILIVLLVIVLVGPFLVPVPPASGTVPAQQLADEDSQFIEINGLSVHVKTAGEGERVFILMHGFGASLFSWHAVMEPLGEYGRVIAYDRPAFGLTERPMEWGLVNPYGAEANKALLLGLLNHFEVEKAVLVGNSAGGTLAMQFALEYPERVEALILVDPAVLGGTGGPSWVRLLSKTPQMQHLGPLLVRSIQSSGVSVINTAWHDPAKITQETIDGYTKPLKADNWDRALWYFTTAASANTGLTEHLQDFVMPVLIITGDDDRIVPTVESVELANEMPGSELRVIPAAGHVPHEEQPDLFMFAVDEFVSSLP